MDSIKPCPHAQRCIHPCDSDECFLETIEQPNGPKIPFTKEELDVFENFANSPWKQTFEAGQFVGTCEPGCIADHSEDDYCILEDPEGDPKRYLPEAAGGPGAAVISSGTLDTSKLYEINGRRANRRTIAIKEGQRTLPRVVGCGHKLDLSKQPRHRNCQTCWTAFWRNQPEMAENVAKNFSEQKPVETARGPKHPIEFIHGREFLRQFFKYVNVMVQVEQLQRQYAQQEINDARENLHPFSGDAEASSEFGEQQVWPSGANQ